MRPQNTDTYVARTRDELLLRNRFLETFFRAEAARLAEACHEVSRRLLGGGWARRTSFLPSPRPANGPC
jgi:hypothetical protein